MKVGWSLTAQPSGNAQQGWQPKKWGAGSQAARARVLLKSCKQDLGIPRKHTQVLRYISSTKWKELEKLQRQLGYVYKHRNKKQESWPPSDMKVSTLLERGAFQVFLSFNLSSMLETDECWFKIGLLFLSLCCFL